MKKKNIIIYVTIGLIIAIIVSFILWNFVINKNEKDNPNTDMLLYLETNMIKYGNKLVEDRMWIDIHKENKTNEINLYGIVDDQDFDKEIFNYIDCDYDDTKLFINIDKNYIYFDTELDCIINKDDSGIYYNEKKLQEELNNHGQEVLETIKNEITENMEIVFYLEHIKNNFDFDLSMFEENYDFNKTSLSIIISNYNNGKYDVDYKTTLVLKEEKDIYK